MTLVESVLGAIQAIDSISDHARLLKDRPTEYAMVSGVYFAEPPEVSDRRFAPEVPAPAIAQHDTLLVTVLELLEPNGTFHSWAKHKFLEKPRAIQKALIHYHSLAVPLPVIEQAQQLKNRAA